MQQAMMNMRRHRPKWGIKPHKEMRVKTSWLGFFYDNISFKKLNQGGLLYLMNMSSYGMCYILWKLEKCVYVAIKNIKNATNSFNCLTKSIWNA